MPNSLFVAVVYLLYQIAHSQLACDVSSDEDGYCQGDALHLLQRSAGEHRVQVSRTRETCTVLNNAEAYYTSPLEIGSPPQTINAVLDTGSGPLVIESCECRDHGRCEAGSHCLDSSKSVTFSDEGVAPQIMYYGSGDIKVSQVTDNVRFANVEAKMDKGVMLMTETRLDISAPEGILGLGLPGAKDDITEGFLHFAKVGTFSICFNQDLQGSLVVGQSMNAQKKLAQLGNNHWLLNIQSVSVGNDAATAMPVNVCDPATPSSCAAIPDTGTTNILVPTSHYYTLFASMCDQWERCKAAQPKGADDPTKYTTFTDLLKDCGTWMGAKGIDELPSLNIQLVGAAGSETTLSLSPWTWVEKSNVMEVKMSDAGYPKETGKTVTNCVATFSPVDFDTSEVGALWVLGLPLFYDYVVGFDLTSNPYSIGFSKDPCSSCGSADLVKSKEQRLKVEGQALRGVSKFQRQIHIDTSKPL